MQIDKWGRPLINLDEESEPYMIDAATSGTTYVCYDNSAKRIIRKIKETGSVTTVEFAYGAWADRATLAYVPINDAFTVAD